MMEFRWSTLKKILTLSLTLNFVGWGSSLPNEQWTKVEIPLTFSQLCASLFNQGISEWLIQVLEQYNHSVDEWQTTEIDQLKTKEMEWSPASEDEIPEGRESRMGRRITLEESYAMLKGWSLQRLSGY